MKNSGLSITCPNCGKLNVIGSERCSNCGRPLPIKKQWEGQLHHHISKRVVGSTLTIAVVLVMIFLGIIIQHNQVLSYTTFINSAPQKVVLANAHHHPVKTVYLIGDRRQKTATGVQGTLVVANRIRSDKNYRSLKPVDYIDSRQRGMLEVKSKPAMDFYYPSQDGKLKYNGECRVARHPAVKYFSWQNTSGGVTK